MISGAATGAATSIPRSASDARSRSLRRCSVGARAMRYSERTPSAAASASRARGTRPGPRTARRTLRALSPKVRCPSRATRSRRPARRVRSPRAVLPTRSPRARVRFGRVPQRTQYSLRPQSQGRAPSNRAPRRRRLRHEATPDVDDHKRFVGVRAQPGEAVARAFELGTGRIEVAARVGCSADGATRESDEIRVVSFLQNALRFPREGIGETDAAGHPRGVGSVQHCLCQRRAVAGAAQRLDRAFEGRQVSSA